MDNKKNFLIIIGVAILAIIVVMAVVMAGNQKPASNNSGGGEVEVKVAPTDLDTEQVIATPEEVMQAKPVVEGTSKVMDNIVVTPTGKPVKNDARPGSPEAPQQTAPISVEDLPSGSVKLTGSADGFKPSTFEVKAGQLVTMSLTSVDKMTHVLLFDDPSLAAVAIGVGPDETRAITFNAPKAGEYAFHCDVPGHAARGEKGTMIVK
ncbi:MAG TPA: cupredoxin domain-containing protein [bacterium]|jgi:plastocyanin|nr:cupredoxin domain-containing protein [bacterium]HNZ51710.1 cupredoxin domain-containing protein [bacterium]HOF79513.1 cupredoxin domain-containing protein [bacterium]HOH85694.1 cupredoxin domain-containing protein [bacterium]HOQ91702.1 cupredoxin domain-containing protein [bacterium]